MLIYKMEKITVVSHRVVARPKGADVLKAPAGCDVIAGDGVIVLIVMK